MKGALPVWQRARCLIADAAAVLTAAVAAGGCKLLLGEGDSGEHLTGVFRTARSLATFLGGDTVIQYRHNQLGIPL